MGAALANVGRPPDTALFGNAHADSSYRQKAYEKGLRFIDIYQDWEVAVEDLVSQDPPFTAQRY